MGGWGSVGCVYLAGMLAGVQVPLHHLRGVPLVVGTQEVVSVLHTGRMDREETEEDEQEEDE